MFSSEFTWCGESIYLPDRFACGPIRATVWRAARLSVTMTCRPEACKGQITACDGFLETITQWRHENNGVTRMPVDGRLRVELLAVLRRAWENVGCRQSFLKETPN